MTVPLGMPFTDSEALEKFFLWTLMDPGLEHFLITKNAVIASWQDFSL